MGLMKNMLKGAAWGGLLSGGLMNTMAKRDWKSRNMYEAQDWTGKPLFQRRHIQDETNLVMQAFDMDRWDAMGRNYVGNQTMNSALAGALLGGTAAYLRKREEHDPHRMPHPRGLGLGIRGAVAAPAA